MIAYYFDSSAWLKRYWVERGTQEVKTLFGSGSVLGSSEIGRLELTASFARKRISGQINAFYWTILMSELAANWSAFHQVRLDAKILEHASTLAETYGLRAGDAIHLASATQMASQFMDRNFRTILVSSDLELNSAAQDIGFEVLDPNLAVP